MAQATAMEAKDQHTQHDQIGDDEVSELQRPPSIYQKVREQAERFASTRLGQFVIERADRALKLVEDTTKWSLPQDKNSSGVVLERPLPWAPFLLLIVVLRLARIWLSMGALMIGNGPVSPTDMIYFIQTRRRKLRAIRVHGLRVMRSRQQESSSSSWRSNGYVQQLSQWLSRAICQPGVQRANSGRVLNVRALDTKQQQGNQQNQSVAKRPRDEDANEDCNLTIDEMLSKYANENSEDDSDFVPQAEDETSTSGTSSESESESHSSEQISSTEEQANVEQHKENLKPNQNEQNHAQKAKTTFNGSANGSDKERTEVAALKEDEQWKSTPGHVSAALLNTRLYNNTAAAANTDPASSPPTPSHDPEPEPASNSDTDSSSTSTLCSPQPPLPLIEPQPELAPETPSPNLDEPYYETASCQIDQPTLDTLMPVQPDPDTSTPAYLDLPTECLKLTNLDLPTVDTLTPATSSEDIFYSPIGSPNNFNTVFGNQSVLRSVIINSVPTHSTPNSELEEIHSAGSDLEEATRRSITLAHSREDLDTPSSTKQSIKPQQQQQQQRQFNHSHQRFRGRNRR